MTSTFSIHDNIPCARCKVRHNGITAKTIAGAIRKATLICKGIIRSGEKVGKATICAQSFLRGDDD